MFDAAAYYELQVPGLGEAFLDRVDSATAEIAQNPERWPIIDSNIRRRLLPRFPYGLLYRVDPDEVVILAVAHLHRRPWYWVKRG